ncbi:MAG: type II toxin-antitoxin system Phd/YefM family antitoxin [Candidatus Yonathbacteria bacterium]|nr:type II toxin-antitoxin system Phd/YefM family antitoxin [Candidatus Niyogibacteria bacterium]MBI5817065.1 type II toxin-antitoxin system Phd/YefM family antitoxin [Candidatus Yonathbacteria bacterium]
MNNSITATKARKDFFKLIEEANRPGYPITITVGGNPKVVMISSEEFEGWQETLEIMGDKALMEGIKKALIDVKKNRLYGAQKVRKKLKI